MNRFTTTLAIMATIILTLSSCERVIIANTKNQTPDDAEVLIMTNDTAAFYLSSREIKGVTLSSMSDADSTNL